MRPEIIVKHIHSVCILLFYFDRSDNSSESKESIDLPVLKKCVCDLKACLQNIVNQNQELRFLLKSKVRFKRHSYVNTINKFEYDFF